MNVNDGTWLRPLLEGFLDEATLMDVLIQPHVHQHTPLADLGLDSMAVMGLVLRLENLFEIDIDYGTFDLEMLRTPAAVQRYLLSAGVLMNAQAIG